MSLSGYDETPNGQVDLPERVVKMNKRTPIDPIEVTKSLGFQTFRRESRKPWSKSEDDLLRSLVLEEQSKNPGKHDFDNEVWELICTKLGSVIRKPKDCRKRWVSSLDPNLKKGKWTPEEDQKLLLAYQKHGASWQNVALEIERRTDDQCAKRYIEVLDPNTKDRLRKWDRNEDLELIRKVKRYGTKWRTISAEMRGRPSLTCRNRWRKIVTEVARGKADMVIRKEVDLISKTGDVTTKEESVEVKTETESDKYLLSQKNTPSVSTRENTPLTELSHALENQLHSEVKREQTSNVRQEIPINTNAYTPLPRTNTKSPRPVQSGTDWKYSLTTAHGEEIPNGFGPIDSQERAQALINLAKDQGISITVHQHITHHYAPQTVSVLEPETQLARYQHFNYLPPLAEVPKLTSSHTSPAGSSGSTGKESDLVRLLNTERGKTSGMRAMSPPINYRENRSPKRSRFNESYSDLRSSIGPSRQQMFPSNSLRGSDMSRVKAMESKSQQKPEDLEGELDFWESMKTFTHASPNVPSSMNTPNHQPQQSQFQQDTSNRFPMPFNYHPSHQQQSSTPGPSGTFGAIYGYEEDEDDEDGHREPLGVYYGNNTASRYTTHYDVRNYQENEASDGHNNTDNESSGHDNEEFGGGPFGLMPFNPS